MSTSCHFKKPETLAYSSAHSNGWTDPVWVEVRVNPPFWGWTASTRTAPVLPSECSGVAVVPACAAFTLCSRFHQTAPPTPAATTSRSRSHHFVRDRLGASTWAGGDAALVCIDTVEDLRDQGTQDSLHVRSVRDVTCPVARGTAGMAWRAARGVGPCDPQSNHDLSDAQLEAPRRPHRRAEKPPSNRAVGPIARPSARRRSGRAGSISSGGGRWAGSPPGLVGLPGRAKRRGSRMDDAPGVGPPDRARPGPSPGAVARAARTPRTAGAVAEARNRPASSRRAGGPGRRRSGEWLAGRRWSARPGGTRSDGSQRRTRACSETAPTEMGPDEIRRNP